MSHALVKTSFDKQTFEVKESYQLMRRKLVDAADFVEVTSKEGNKLIINKMEVDVVVERPLTVKEAVKGK